VSARGIRLGSSPAREAAVAAESERASPRHRTIRPRGYLSNKTELVMIFKLAQAAEKSCHRLRGHDQLPKVILGLKFNNKTEVVKSQAQAAFD
jgi:putative transposase